TEEQGLFFELKQTRVQAYGICISNLSLIELNLNFVKVDIPSTVVSENLTLNFTKQTNSRENFVLKIYNILGKLIFETEEPITDQVSLPLSFISSGIYKVEILIKNQKYSKIISVIN
ncbi:MAG: T9SS type A sorting domain-containing protein, partial [Candidatus Kapaibacteriota bacterium]